MLFDKVTVSPCPARGEDGEDPRVAPLPEGHDLRAAWAHLDGGRLVDAAVA
jgi:hypothetical protein